VGSGAVSGFSPDWLALREPADRQARNHDVLAACARHFKDAASIEVCDLGAGTGSSLRALAEHLPPQQQWTLVDHDSANLSAALTALAAWAEKSHAEGEALILSRGGKTIAVRTRVYDFAQDPACWPASAELITASALFDLASTAWIARFVAALEGRPLLAMLTADERLSAMPAHPLDAQIFSAFHRHQTRDKGFGPAAGAAAAKDIERLLAARGYRLTAADSPWRLESSPLLQATVEGMATAVIETTLVSPTDVAGWLAHQRSVTRRFVVGHRDVFAAMA